jgi:dUTP pyrophosphatase
MRTALISKKLTASIHPYIIIGYPICSTRRIKLMTEVQKIKIKVINNAYEGKLPEYETSSAAGVDVRSILDTFTLKPGSKSLIPTGLKVSIPIGFEIQVRPRSGLAHKHFISVTNSPGTIDSDYRGDIGVILENRGTEEYIVKKGERIAQLVLAPIYQIDWEVVDSLDETERGEGGFGSTGK